MQVLERLLQRNPKHPLGLQMLRQLRVEADVRIAPLGALTLAAGLVALPLLSCRP